ncbi:uncharacterized protein LOC110266219 [Arachis ipaensis]|uniref:uncharacterized protein LOC110266219 n=1 Tax=Arachis ipaensis TaxID=130454 RepID=UPI000A2B72A6|nr:uncharacterized protein LOC110266219 [Arachis ipaensis]
MTSLPAIASPAAISSGDGPSNFLSLLSPVSSPPKSQHLPFVLDQEGRLASFRLFVRIHHEWFHCLCSKINSKSKNKKSGVVVASVLLHSPHPLWPSIEASILVNRKALDCTDTQNHNPHNNEVGEAIPLSNASVDAVVGTLVLCSVKDVDLALKERSLQVTAKKSIYSIITVLISLPV